MSDGARPARVADDRTPEVGRCPASARVRRRRARLPLPLSLGLTAGLTLLILHYVAQTSVVAGESMAPTLANGEIVVVDKLAYALDGHPSPASLLGAGVRRTDVVAVRDPEDPRRTLVKRILGLAGDRVAYDALGRVSVNGGPEPASGQPPDPDAPGYTVVVVGERCYFVVGDNRLHSTDSRAFGLVSRSAIVGKVTFVVWPIRRLGGVR